VGSVLLMALQTQMAIFLSFYGEFLKNKSQGTHCKMQVLRRNSHDSSCLYRKGKQIVPMPLRDSSPSEFSSGGCKDPINQPQNKIKKKRRSSLAPFSEAHINDEAIEIVSRHHAEFAIF